MFCPKSIIGKVLYDVHMSSCSADRPVALMQLSNTQCQSPRMSAHFVANEMAVRWQRSHDGVLSCETDRVDLLTMLQ